MFHAPLFQSTEIGATRKLITQKFLKYRNEININIKNRSKYTFRDDKRNLEKKKNFSFLKQWVGDNFF